jgi:hypothetical protein
MLLTLACSTLAAAVPAVEGFQPPFYFAKDIRATVVDETSGHPVPDVVVVALWELRQVSARPRLHVAETMTDAQGRFHIPGWGPKLRPPLAELGDRSPLLLFFKRGFVPLRLHNESRARVEQFVPNYRTLPTRQLQEMIAWHRGSPEDALQDCIWDGLTLQLEPFQGSAERWLQYLHGITDTVRDDEVAVTVTLHRRLLDERRFYGHTANAAIGQRASAFFGGVERRLQETSP